MTDTRYSGEFEVRYFLGPDLLARRLQTSAPISGDFVTIDGEEHDVGRRAVRFDDVTEAFDAFEVQLRGEGSAV